MSSIPRDMRPRPDEGYSEGASETTSDDYQEEDLQADMMDMDRMIVEQVRLQLLPVTQQDRKLAATLVNLRGPEQTTFFSFLFAHLTVERRQELAKVALANLPTSSLAQLFEDFAFRLHINPVVRLPFELTEIILQNMSPLDVIRCSMTSKDWRSRALDSRLWKLFYLREGWRVDVDAVRRVAKPDKFDSTKAQRRKHESSVDVRESRKRQRELRQQEELTSSADDRRSWNAQHDAVEADEDQSMEGVESNVGERSTVADVEGLDHLSPYSGGNQSPVEAVAGTGLNEDALRLHDCSFELNPPVSPLATCGSGSEKSLNWFWLYKQRRRLESNWDNGRYQLFQLPKAEFMDEAHDECVYTIQFSGHHLVSGSRDKSIKVWDLNTQRCLRTLKDQHDQSVLCLQFDIAQDVVVSGGSDSFVVIWRFSDGKALKKMTTAHRESVLNLRFDDRYLITCSKDKTIKIWNMKAIMSNDPLVPEMSREQFAHDPPKVLEPFTLLGTLGGHGAAVNAIQIYKDTIVSASGDRTIRMWNIQTGECLKDFNGHIKGIACVQFDGRRVVSGSSDNTVRIFDAATKGEVACLQGHTNLVRTVQARFGDQEVTDEELERLAQETQEKWAKSLDNLSRMPETSSARHGLDRVQDVRSINAKIPQGGGGNRWSRIVSGSYDETIIIWKKDTNGKWIANRRLYQNELLANARSRGLRQRAPGLAGHGHHHHQGQIQGPNAAGHHQAGAVAGLGQAQGQIAGQPQQQPQQHALQQQLPPAAPAGQNGPNAAGWLHGAQNLANRQRILMQYNNRQRAPGMIPLAAPAAEETNSNRVFKLQFDARRIVCCSQNRIIVGWDFANGDSELNEAAKFFAETD